ncbi:hypothetical protein ACIRP3_42310 [Streptomyces sp. NPDC101209]|uniref:hypothetical protein n=1 Tax=Streptomyces sp. NPDC101209 TaxID=3366129 RepID=UPI0037F89FD5
MSTMQRSDSAPAGNPALRPPTVPSERGRRGLRTALLGTCALGSPVGAWWGATTTGHSHAAVLSSVTVALVGLVTLLGRQLPGWYWMTHYTRLVKRGAELATTPSEIKELIDSIAAAQGTLPVQARDTQTESNPKAPHDNAV